MQRFFQPPPSLGPLHNYLMAPYCRKKIKKRIATIKEYYLTKEEIGQMLYDFWFKYLFKTRIFLFKITILKKIINYSLPNVINIWTLVTWKGIPYREILIFIVQFEGTVTFHRISTIRKNIIFIYFMYLGANEK